jgi:hypothetical protein
MIPDAGSPAPSNSSASTVGERADVSVQATLADGRAMLLERVADRLAIRESWRSAIGNLMSAESAGSEDKVGEE